MGDQKEVQVWQIGGGFYMLSTGFGEATESLPVFGFGSVMCLDVPSKPLTPSATRFYW